MFANRWKKKMTHLEGGGLVRGRGPQPASPPLGMWQRGQCLYDEVALPFRNERTFFSVKS